MNDRIKELYEQAYLVREYPDSDPMRGGNPPTLYWGGEASAKKFAELIVRECANLCQKFGDELENNRPNKDFDTVAHDCAGIIKEHFGVE
jgi:hypothetical protein